MSINSYKVEHPGDLTHDSDGPMTEKQAVILRELAEAADAPFDANLTERQAQERIEALRLKLGRE